MQFVSLVDEIMRTLGLSHYGLTPLTRPISMEVYRAWLEAGHHGSMKYLQDHADIKENPHKLSARAHSALVILKPYLPHPYPSTPHAKNLRIAQYARGEDYHIHFKAELETAARQLRDRMPDQEFLCFTDSAPILERDLAYRAGLGWIGKNTCLLSSEAGSLFFIGEILTSIPVQDLPASLPDMCGTCDRCIRACPTGALEKPRHLNATKCISYWTIEAKEEAPESLRRKFGDWFFGCDICQTVCPWNEKVFRKPVLEALSGSPHDEAQLIHDLRWILKSSNNELARALKTSPLSRARPHGLKRNALVVIGNRRFQALSAEVQEVMTNPRLKKLAEWTAAQLNS